MTASEWTRHIPWTLVLSAVGLMVFGLAGIGRGDELVGRGDYFARQVVWIGLSLPAMAAATAIPYRRLREWSFPLFGLSLLLLVVVFFMPARNGSHRWIPLGLVSFQPSELAKLAFLMALAHYLMYRKNYRRLWGLIPPFLLTLLPLMLVLREPDLGTSLLFLPVLFAMLFAAGARPRHLAFVGCLGLAVLPVLWMGMSGEQQSRIVALFTQRDGGPLPRGDGYHLYQSKRLLARGGVWGDGAAPDGSGDRSAYHLPAARTDFVLCLIGERFGLLGVLTVLLLYLTLFGRGLAVAAATQEPFGRLLAVGIVSLLAAQTVINAGMTVGLMPITGMTLPLISYGGSSLLATSLALGLLANIGLRPGYEVTGEPFRFADEES